MYPIACNEKQTECPICGHVCLIFEDYENKEIVYMCPDRYCKYCRDRYDD
jgi:hypothetical protein